MRHRLWIVLAAAAALTACEKGASEKTSEPTAKESADNSPVTYCAEVGRQITVNECSYFSELAKSTEAGVGAFNVPSPMRRGTETPLQLVIAFAPPVPPLPPVGATAASASAAGAAEPDTAPASSLPDKALIGGGTAGLPGTTPKPAAPTPEQTVDPLPGETVSFTPTVGRFMAATLTGQGFDIVANSPASQEVVRDGQTVWNWTITAKRRGPLNLTLTTVVEAIDERGTHIPLKSTVKNQTVAIEVMWWQQLGDGLDAAPLWMKRATAVLTGLAALFVAWFALRKTLRNGGNSA